MRPDRPGDRAAAVGLGLIVLVGLIAHTLGRLGSVPVASPWLLPAGVVVATAAALAVTGVLAVGLRWWLTRRALDGRIRVQLLAPEDFDPDVEAIEQMASQLARTRPAGGWLTRAASAVRFEISTDCDGLVQYVISGPRKSRGVLESALGAYPDVELHDLPQPVEAEGGGVVRVRMVLARSAREPLAEVGLQPDLLQAVAAAMSAVDADQGERATLALDVRALRAGEARRLRRRLLRDQDGQPTRGMLAGLLDGAPGLRTTGRMTAGQSVARRQDTQGLNRKLAPDQTLLQFSLALQVRAAHRGSAVAVMRSLMGALDGLAGANHLRAHGLRLGGLGFLGYDLPGTRSRFDRRLRSGRLVARRGDVVSAREIQGLLKPPTVHCQAQNVARSRGAIPAPPRELVDYHGQTGVIPLGRVHTRTSERVVGVRVADTFFAYMAGRSRYGKTETAIGQFVALVRSGAGGLFLDPHADAIAEIKSYLTDAGVRERVIEIDLSDRTAAGKQPTWNLFALAERTPMEAAARVEAFVDALAAALRWDERNTRALNLATQAAQALVELALVLPAELAPTIFQVPTLLSDETFRQAALPHLSAATRGFFSDRFPSLPGEAITAVTNLIDRLHAGRSVAALLGSPVSSYDARRAMASDAIVLACPGSGSTRDRLVANLLVYDVLHAAKARATMAPDQRRAFWVFLDELQTYDGPNLPALLEQSAKYGGRAFLFNQNPERLTQATWNAVSTNRSHLLATTINAKAARMISAEWGTPPAADVLTRLDRFTYLASVTVGTQVARPFLVHGIPARELHADHHHPQHLPELEAAIDQTAGRQPTEQLLAALDGHDQRILAWLTQHQRPGGPTEIDEPEAPSGHQLPHLDYSEPADESEGPA